MADERVEFCFPVASSAAFCLEVGMEVVAKEDAG